MFRRCIVVVLVPAVLAACNSSTNDPDVAEVTITSTAVPDPTSAAPDTTTSPETTVVPETTDVPRAEPDPALDLHDLLAALADDATEGRGPGTDGSRLAQRILIDQLDQFAEPAFPDREGDDGFLQPFADGANVLALIPGTDLADEYVIVGGHYDHLGTDCHTDDPADTVCNGATDNAAGVAVAVSIARAIATEGLPRRSVLVALWDAEEIGLRGALAYLADPVVPLEQTVAYLNFDIQGAVLLPSLANFTIAVGAETGGEALRKATSDAASNATLDTALLSLVFGQGRSDHAPFAAAQVPIVFFSDSTSGCYHSAQDDLTAVDFDKLDQQLVTGRALARHLVDTDEPPVFDSSTPVATYDDAVAMVALATAAAADFGIFDEALQETFEDYVVQITAVVAAGPDAFGEAEVGVLLGGAALFVQSIADGPCTPA